MGAVEIINETSEIPLVLAVDHASNHIPIHLNNLGLSGEDMEAHIAWDIGAEKLAREFSERLGAKAIVARFSRLLIDPNRRPEQIGFIPEVSDGISIPGNQNLSQSEINERIESYYTPFHNALGEGVAAHLKAGRRPLVVGIHSFTPNMNDFARPWHIGFMWDKDDRLPKALMPTFQMAGKVIGHNQPYGGDEFYHTMGSCAGTHGLAHTQIEIRQDLMTENKDIMHWADLLTEAFQNIIDHPDLNEDYRNKEKF